MSFTEFPAFGRSALNANLYFQKSDFLSPHSSGDSPVAIPENIRKNWIEIQKKFEYPVNAIGVKIDTKDAKTLAVWKEEGIDQYQKK